MDPMFGYFGLMMHSCVVGAHQIQSERFYEGIGAEMSCELSGPAGTPDENELIKTAAALLPCALC